MDKKNQPMDDSTVERKTGTPTTNHQRVCGAIKQLVKEVTDLFPETIVEYSNYDGRNTALDVTLDFSKVGEEAADLLLLFSLDFDAEPRVDYVLVGDESKTVMVSMISSLRTQDSRDEFGVVDAYEVLTGDDKDLVGWVDEAADFPGGSL